MVLEDFLQQRVTLQNIKRFSMEPTVRSQNLCDHGYCVATIFYLLCEETKTAFSATDLYRVMQHDFAESFTGDLNFLVKKKTFVTMEAWDTIEEEVLPKHLQEWTDENLNFLLGEGLIPLFHIADYLDAWLYCKEEIAVGNTNFIKIAQRYSKKVVEQLDLCIETYPELEFLYQTIEANLL